MLAKRGKIRDLFRQKKRYSLLFFLGRSTLYSHQKKNKEEPDEASCIQLHATHTHSCMQLHTICVVGRRMTENVQLFFSYFHPYLPSLFFLLLILLLLLLLLLKIWFTFPSSISFKAWSHWVRPFFRWFSWRWASWCKDGLSLSLLTVVSLLLKNRSRQCDFHFTYGCTD